MPEISFNKGIGPYKEERERMTADEARAELERMKKAHPALSEYLGLTNTSRDSFMTPEQLEANIVKADQLQAADPELPTVAARFREVRKSLPGPFQD